MTKSADFRLDLGGILAHLVPIVYLYCTPKRAGCNRLKLVAPGFFFLPKFEATATSNFTKARQLQLRSSLFRLRSGPVAVFFRFRQPNLETLCIVNDRIQSNTLYT